MQSCELVAAISAIACAISKGKSPDEIALMASIFSQLGDTLATIAAQEALCAPTNMAADTPAYMPEDGSTETLSNAVSDAFTYASAYAATDSPTDAPSNASAETSKDTE